MLSIFFNRRGAVFYRLLHFFNVRKMQLSMKTIRKRWLQCFNILLSGALALLGFSACEIEETPCEYGQPHASYEIKGKVINMKKEPVSDIQVIVNGLITTSYSEWLDSSDTLYTDSKGEFLFRDDFAQPKAKYKIIHRDVRTDTNSSITYKTDSIYIDMPEPTGGSGNWNYGSASKEVTITLKEDNGE